MNNTKLISSLILLGLTIGAGYWLSHAGKPLNQIIFTIHKLLALGAVILAVLAVVQWKSTATIHPLTLALLIFIGVLVVTLFTTGAILSQNKTLPGILLTVHQVATALTLLSTAGVIWAVK